MKATLRDAALSDDPGGHSQLAAVRFYADQLRTFDLEYLAATETA